MFHTVAFYANVNSASPVALSAITDDVLTIENDRFALRSPFDVLYSYVGGVDITRARLSTPALRKFTLPELLPANPTAEPGELPNVNDYRKRPIMLAANENLTIEVAEDNAGAQDVFGILGIKSSPARPVPQRGIYTLRGTATTTLTAEAWTTLSVSWDDTLPAGRYLVVGMWALSASGIAARVRFEDQLHRPGCLCVDDEAEQSDEIFRFGELGVWGEFDSLTMPEIQVFADAADTAQTVLLDIMPAV